MLVKIIIVWQWKILFPNIYVNLYIGSYGMVKRRSLPIDQEQADPIKSGAGSTFGNQKNKPADKPCCGNY